MSVDTNQNTRVEKDSQKRTEANVDQCFKSFKQCVLKNINAKINLVQFERFFSPTFSTLNPVNGLRINANKCAMFHGVFRLTSTVNLTDSRSFFARFLDNLGSRKKDVYPRMQ